ncbi:MAG: outer membrane lipoprotein-sorting protein [Pseudomonadales bacterium]|nr:outer membrane lipoprotein-sorting protein [Pseudomonadales bacterium]
MQITRKIGFFIFAYMTCNGGIAVAAQLDLSQNQQRGLDIALAADHRNDGFTDTSANLTMILRNKRGDASTRLLRVKTLEGIPENEEGDKSLMIFDSPRDQKGTALLTYSYKLKPDDQWIYLPAIKRVKRIASRNKSGPFVGSEFAYEDFNAPEVEKYTYKYLRDEIFEKVDCYVVERYPTDKYSGYKRQQVWLGKQEYRVWKVVSYDRKNSLLKTLTVSGYTLYVEKYWRARSQVMVNHQTGKSTELEFTDFEFRTGLKKADFGINSLKRAR